VGDGRFGHGPDAGRGRSVGGRVRAGRVGVCGDGVDGYQWKSYVKQWIKSKKYKNDISDQLQSLFDKYIPDTFEHI